MSFAVRFGMVQKVNTRDDARISMAELPVGTLFDFFQTSGQGYLVSGATVEDSDLVALNEIKSHSQPEQTASEVWPVGLAPNLEKGSGKRLEFTNNYVDKDTFQIAQDLANKAT